MSRAPRGGVDVGTVGALWRYPVKSTAGESVAAADVDARGLEHDRTWAVYTGDGGIASGKTTRRFRKVEGLMRWRSVVAAGERTGSPGPVLVDPDGATYPVDDPAAADALGRAFSQPLELRRETTVSHHDDCGVHLVTTSSIRRVEELVGEAVDVRRLRANILLDTRGGGFEEDAWIDGELAIGPEVVLGLGPGMPRCVMVEQPQADVLAEPAVLKVLGREHDTVLGLQARVLRTGTVTVGDTVRLTLP